MPVCKSEAYLTIAPTRRTSQIKVLTLNSNGVSIPLMQRTCHEPA